MKVLIVDDDITTVEVIRDTLRWSEFDIDQVYTSYNVANAKAQLKQFKIDIIISDIEMPQETGLDLLKWVRGEGIECEFLLLTCHENFDFAANAIHYQAAAYITKPYEADIMELNLQKVISKLNAKRTLEKNSNYGVWMKENISYMKLDFWKFILAGNVIDKRMIEMEVEKRQLDIDLNKRYHLVCTRYNNIESDVERYGKDIFEFILQGFHSEILTDCVTNERVIKYNSQILSFITICTEDNLEVLSEKSKKLNETCKEYFSSVQTTCISDLHFITDLASVRERIFKLFDHNVASFGKTFLENDVTLSYDSNVQILDMEKFNELIISKEKGQILHYTKQKFQDLMNYNNLNQHSLYLIKQEIIQVIYSYLNRQDIIATTLFQDELSVKLSDQATNSIIDMIKWLNNLLEQTYLIEEKTSLSMTIVEKINLYIHQHYQEDIGRNQLAEIFFLTPEYLAKMYKKKTGIYLTDYINQYRIEQAKELLRTSNMKISEVSDYVGFSNFSYFSTIFKKITGETPKNFKSTCL